MIQTDAASVEAVTREISRIAETLDGRLGAFAIHLESGREISFNATERFPMASTYKVPVAVHALRLVEEGHLRLDGMVTAEPRFLRVTSPLSDYFPRLGIAVPILSLIELMLVHSDNSATDILFDHIGGPKATCARMKQLGLGDILVSRTVVELLEDFANVDLSTQDFISAAHQWEILALLTEPSDELRKAGLRFGDDDRDTATPSAMAGLMAKIWRQEILNAENTALLIDILTRCETGHNRIAGMLPPHIVVANKTGTIPGTVNNVGVLALPDGGGTLAVAVLMKRAFGELTELERVIAQIGRSIYDYFLFNPAAD